MNNRILFRFPRKYPAAQVHRAKSPGLRELREVLVAVSDPSIYHQTCEDFVKEMGDEYTNDFATGPVNSGRTLLAGQLSTVDPFDHRDNPMCEAPCWRGLTPIWSESPSGRALWQRDEFGSNEAVSIIFPAGIPAS